MLKERFSDGTRDFMIGTKRRVMCREYKSYLFYRGDYGCSGDDIVRYDLKNTHDTCDYPSGGLDFTADLVLLDSAGKKPSVYIQVRTDYLAPLTLPPDVLMIEVAVSDEEAAVRLRNEAIIECGDMVHCQFLGPWKRRGGLSSGPLCEKGR